MVNLGVGADTTSIDCAFFRQWPVAASACDELLRAAAPEDKRAEWTLLLAGVFLDPRNYFHFTQVDVPLLKYRQEQVHGLLGQRAISPADAPLASTTPAGRVHGSHQGEGSIAGHYSEYMVPSLAEHTGFGFCRFSC